MAYGGTISHCAVRAHRPAKSSQTHRLERMHGAVRGRAARRWPCAGAAHRAIVGGLTMCNPE
eukprot:2814804-Pleurochrysis_carterae.AAC.3